MRALTKRRSSKSGSAANTGWRNGKASSASRRTWPRPIAVWRVPASLGRDSQSAQAVRREPRIAGRLRTAGGATRRRGAAIKPPQRARPSQFPASGCGTAAGLGAPLSMVSQARAFALALTPAGGAAVQVATPCIVPFFASHGSGGPSHRGGAARRAASRVFKPPRRQTTLALPTPPLRFSIGRALQMLPRHAVPHRRLSGPCRFFPATRPAPAQGPPACPARSAR